LPFPSPKTLESTYIELLKLQKQITIGENFLPVEKPNEKDSSPHSNAQIDPSSPSFDSFYRNKISHADAELDAVYEALSSSQSDLPGMVPSQLSQPLQKRGKMTKRKKNPMRDLYLPWKSEQKTRIGSAIFNTVAPSHLQLSHVYSLHYKNTLYDKALRSVWQLCPPALTRSLSLLRGLLDGFSHDTVVLDHILSEHKQLLRSPSALLAIGEVPIINFDLDAINSSTPTPSSLRWLAQSKVNGPASLSTVEISGLDSIHMHRGRNQSSNQFSFSALPSYLSDGFTPHPSTMKHPSAIFSTSNSDPDQISPRDQNSPFSSHQHLPMPNDRGNHVHEPCSHHPLGLLAESVGLARIGIIRDAPSSHPPACGASYIAPGAPLMSELAMATSNAHIAHRLDYLAADLTSISSLLWPASACPSAYFPPSSNGGSLRNSPNVTQLPYGASLGKNDLSGSGFHSNAPPPHSLNTAIANFDFGSFMGLGTAASSAAIASGALSLPLSMSPPVPGSTQGQSSNLSSLSPNAARMDASRLTKMRNVPNTAPSTFTSCIACKQAAIDSLLVQLQHDAICIKSGEDEASHLWNIKWRDIHRPHIPITQSNSASSLNMASTKDSPLTLLVQSTEVPKPKIDLENSSQGSGNTLTGSHQVSSIEVTSSDTNSSQNMSDAKVTTYATTTIQTSAVPVVVGVQPQSKVASITSPASVDPSSYGNPELQGHVKLAASTPNMPSSTPASLTSTPTPMVMPSHSASNSPAPTSKKSSTSTTTTTSNSRKSSSFASSNSIPNTQQQQQQQQSSSSSSSNPSSASGPPYVPVSEMNLLHLRNRFSFLRHVIFSLLKGRPVVIHAEARHRPWVEQVIASLTCFVPGHHLSSDSLSQTLFQLDSSTERHSSSQPQYIPRHDHPIKVVPWRDARDVIFEAIHGQSVTGSSTKCRLKHTKLVITRFLQLHLQKMKSYATLGKPETTSSAESILASHVGSSLHSANVNEEQRSTSSTPSLPLYASSSASHNIPTLGSASRQALKLAQLSHLKLIGLDKSCPIPKTVERYITYWDWEAEELTCVAYEKGKLLDAMINPKKQWPDEASYRSHIHFHLSDLATRSWMYYHMCCIGLVIGGLSTTGGLSQSPLAAPPPSTSAAAAQPTYQLPSHQTQLPQQTYSNQSGGGVAGKQTSDSRFSLSQSGIISPSTSDFSSSKGNHDSIGLGTNAVFTTNGWSAAGGLQQTSANLSSGTSKRPNQTLSKTSPAAVAVELGFEPPNGMVRSSSSAQTNSMSTTSPPTTPQQHNNKSLHSSVGPSLSTGPSFEFTSAPSLVTPNQTTASKSSLEHFGGPSASPYKSTSTGKAPVRLSKTGSSSSFDPKLVSDHISIGAGNSIGPSPADYAFQAHVLQQRTKTAYFASLKLLEHDSDIIEYLAELIKTQQSQEVKGQGSAFQAFSSLQVNDLLAIALSEPQSHLSSTGLPSSSQPPPPQTIKLDFSPLRKFKNMLLS
jgi:hypothetical protein